MKEKFIETIKSNLDRNGFPDKKVSLPLEKLYEAAENKGLSLNDCLLAMENEGIFHEKTTEKIIFRGPAQNPFNESYVSAEESSKAQNSSFDMNNVNPDMFKGKSKEDIQKQAQDYMSQMSPDQLKQIQEMYAKMSPEEKQKIMDQARNMGMM